MKKVMVFGVFDGFHQGHEVFLREAKKLGDHLIAVVAQDHIVRHMTGADPSANLSERFEEIEHFDGVDEVVIGDFELAIWKTVERYKPDVVVFGKDQTLLAENFSKHSSNLSYRPSVVTLDSFEVNRL